MRAARRITSSPPGAPVIATTTRSRVSHGPRDAVGLAVLLERLVDPVGDPHQRELAERAEVALPEVVGERGVDLLGRVDVAVRHPAAQRLRRHVDELDLVGGPHDRVGDRLLLLDPGDLLDDVVHRLEVLHVDGGDDVDAGVEELVDVLPALLVARARHVGVRELVDQRDARGFRAMTASTSISSNVDAAVVDPPARDDLEVADLRLGVRRGRGSRRSRRRRRCRAARARLPSFSIAKVLPTPGAAPR